jgi:hypothetical protein
MASALNVFRELIAMECRVICRRNGALALVRHPFVSQKTSVFEEFVG